MRAACVIAAGSIAAALSCGKHDGTYLEIRLPPKTSAVELFLGDAPAGSSMIGPPTTFSASATGRYYNGEGWTSFEDVSVFGTVSGSALVYRLAPDGRNGVLPRLLIVAYDDQGQPIAEQILRGVPVAGGAANLPVTLDPVIAIGGSGSGERIQVWRRPGDKSAQRSACAMVLHPSDAAGSAVEFFVPSDDTDCDGALPNASECTAASAWNWCDVEGTPQGLSEASCLATNPSSGACRFAGMPTCVDRGSDCPPPSCAPTSIVGCFPGSVCVNAAATSCSDFGSKCFYQALNAPGVPKLVCPLVQSGSAGMNCSNGVDAQNYGALLGTRTCVNEFLLTVPASGTGDSVIADGVSYHLSGTGCTRLLDIAGAPSGGATTPVMIVFDTLQGSGSDEYIAVALAAITATGTCGGNPVPCSLDSVAPIACP